MNIFRDDDIWDATIEANIEIEIFNHQTHHKYVNEHSLTTMPALNLLLAIDLPQLTGQH